MTKLLFLNTISNLYLPRINNKKLFIFIFIFVYIFFCLVSVLTSEVACFIIHKIKKVSFLFFFSPTMNILTFDIYESIIKVKSNASHSYTINAFGSFDVKMCVTWTLMGNEVHSCLDN